MVQFETIEEWNKYLESLGKERGRNLTFDLKEKPTNYLSHITGYCNEIDQFGRVHGEFNVRLDHYLKGESLGCKKCSGSYSPTSEEFREILRFIYPIELYPKVSFEKSTYKKRKGHTIVTCSEHGDQLLSVEALLRGDLVHLCHGCEAEAIGNRKRISEKEIIKRIKFSFPSIEYDFSKFHYKNENTPVTLICPIHGEFNQYPYLLFRGLGCPSCREHGISCGERRIMDWLNLNNIKFERNRVVQGEEIRGRNSNKILPDFQILGKDKKLIWIEFNGEQHYRYSSLFHSTLEDFKKQQDRDIFVENYCREKDIYLIVISYIDFNNIESILETKLIPYL
jgi:hypothetical protein